jgi:hypothetical protein
MYVFRIDLLHVVTLTVGGDLDAELSLNKSAAIQKKHFAVPTLPTPPFFHEYSCYIVYC